MRLDLRDIIDTPGAVRDFSYELDLRKVELYGGKPFTAPFQVDGRVRNAGGALTLTGHAVARVSGHCDRCLKPITVDMDVAVNTLLAEEVEDEESDEIVLLDDRALELNEVFTTECILAWDGKHLCSEDCKGLCPTCGKDLNEGPCGCGKELDPRFAALAKLLDKGPEEPEDD